MPLAKQTTVYAARKAEYSLCRLQLVAKHDSTRTAGGGFM